MDESCGFIWAAGCNEHACMDHQCGIANTVIHALHECRHTGCLSKFSYKHDSSRPTEVVSFVTCGNCGQELGTDIEWDSSIQADQQGRTIITLLTQQLRISTKRIEILEGDIKKIRIALHEYDAWFDDGKLPPSDV